MNIFRSTVLLIVITIGVSSCAPRAGEYRPMNLQRLHGFHRGGGYGHGAGHYNPPPREHRSYRHYRNN